MPDKTNLTEFEGKLQQLAWEEIHTLGWWFRMRYDLPPKDPRYLAMSRAEITQDYLSHELSSRLNNVRKAGAFPETLEELLALPDMTPMTDDEFNRQLRELDAADDRKAAEQRKQLVPGVALAPTPSGDELIIDFKG